MHQRGALITVKGRQYQTLRCPHRVLIRADVGRITMTHAYSQVGAREHHYYMSAASIHRYKVLAGAIKNDCLRQTRESHKATD